MNANTARVPAAWNLGALNLAGSSESLKLGSAMRPIHVPDEVLRLIFRYVSPEDNLSSIQLVSRRFYNIANEQLLWRDHCNNSFRYWHPRHQFSHKLDQAVTEVDWKGLFLTRKRRNVYASNLLDRTLETKVDRLRHIEEICRLGYDAKDFLIEQGYHTSDEAEDFLARRYFAHLVLNSIYRGIAIDTWYRWRDHNPHCPRSLEQCMGAFDMFISRHEFVDSEHGRRFFDDMAAAFLNKHPMFSAMTTRQKALALLNWLRDEGFQGLRDHTDLEYRRLGNCLLGMCLIDLRHRALPITSSVVFTSLAARFDIMACCFALPGHVCALVRSPQDRDLDGNLLPEGAARDTASCTMYLDPWGSSSELTMDDLRQRHASIRGAPPWTDEFLSEIPVRQLVARNAANIHHVGITYHQLLRAGNQQMAADLVRLDSGGQVEVAGLDAEGRAESDLHAMLLAADWATLMMMPTADPDWGADLDRIMHSIVQNWSEDLWILERYLLPLYNEYASDPERAGEHRTGWDNVVTVLKMLRNLDERQPILMRRYTQEIRDMVQYKIGQVFRHRRYSSIGIIIGWVTQGAAATIVPHEEDAHEMNDSLRSHRVLYLTMKVDNDALKIGQDNVEIITDPSLIPERLMFQAGKCFKRFDAETCTFVSNITEFYPDD